MTETMTPDTFDVFNFKHYQGPNPYLNTAAFVFDFTVLENANPLKITTYLDEMGHYFPILRGLEPSSYGEMFVRIASEISTLKMGLHFDRYSVQTQENSDRLAIQSLDERTTRKVVYFVWDWLEAITHDQSLDIEEEIQILQESFRRSVFGGASLYSLLKSAYQKGIPAFYLYDERLLQYGYGKYLVRGTGTTFDSDSHIDSNFTVYKDDCKAFLYDCGFPIPKGEIVTTLASAFAVINEIGYPVAVKPVIGHKGIGVTANVTSDQTLEFAFEKAKDALEKGHSEIIIERSVTGIDYRLLCVGGQFVAAVERRPAYVIGDGESTIEALIKRENATEARKDTPTSPLGKIITDDIMERYLNEQELSLESVPDIGETVYLRKVANLSSGGVSLDATGIIHLDNKILAQDIAQYFHLVCLGIDVIAKDISRSWKEGDFGIIEINSAPGVSMHLNPAVGESVDVPSAILDYVFPPHQPYRIPIITFNKLYRNDIYEIVDHILLNNPDWYIGSVCREGMWLNRSQKSLNRDYNSNIKSLLRHPRLDLLIAEYTEETLEASGMVYEGSNLVILEDPTPVEQCLVRDLLPNGTIILKEGQNVSVQVNGLLESYRLTEADLFSYVYLKEIKRMITHNQ